jgi:hypothetical protein
VQQTASRNVERSLKALDRRVRLELSANELRIILGCLRAMEYQMRLDDEPYLDCEGLALKTKLEARYKLTLRA